MIIYSHEVPSIEDFVNLFDTTGWNDSYKLTPNELSSALKNSWYNISAYDNGRLVGYGRIVSDGIVHAVIFDMIIAPEYQGNGIGAEILHLLLTKCRQHKIRDIQLFSAKDKYGFYEKYGFLRRPENAPGMEIKEQY